MLDLILRFSLNNRMIVIFSSVLLMVSGLYFAGKMDVDVFPDITAPTVVVMTDAHGLAAEEVERLVTFPIETAVNGATGVRRVRSASLHGFAFIWVEFDWGMDVMKARQIVSERLITVSATMPSGVDQPMLAPQSSIMGEILLIGLQADSTSMMDLRTLAEWDIKPVLLSTSGVSQVTILGGEYKQYQVLADPYKMRLYGVSLRELENAVAFASHSSGGGILRQHGNEYIVRAMARTFKLDEIGNALVKHQNGMPVLISDVAEVVVAPAVKYGHASQNASPAVILTVSRQPDANTLKLTKEIELSLTALLPSLPPDLRMDTSIFRQADFIETAINNVQKALLEGAVLVVVILMLFLFNFRTTIISVLAIPLSLLATIITMRYLDVSINTMTLGGMAIAIGSLVDDAIIDVENVYKRLRQNRKLPLQERATPLEVVFSASKEIRASILYATIIIIIAFVPLFFLSGMEGLMLRPLGLAYVISLMASLLVAMTITPVLCFFLLTGDKHLEKHQAEPWLSRNISSFYSRSLAFALKHGKMAIGSVALLFVAALFVASNMGRSFLPEFNEGALTIGAVSKPGISLEESDYIGRKMEEAVLAIPEVWSTARRTGRGELDEHSQTSNGAEIDINFSLIDRPREEFMEDVRAKLASVPGVVFTVGQPLGHRIDHMLSGSRSNIAIKIFGDDLSRLQLLGKQVESLVSDIPNLVDVQAEFQTETPEMQLRANREMLAWYGITLGDFTSFAETAFAGIKLADVYEGQRRFDLILRMNSDYTSSLEGMKKALIDAPGNQKVPISHVADFVSTTGPGQISRENVNRHLIVSANVTGGNLTGAVASIRERLNERLNLPEGYRIEYGGQFESAQEASRILLFTSIAAILVIFFLLFHLFKKSALAAIILINLPLALIGGVVAIWLTSNILSIPAIIGFITLFGIATRNGILLISRYQQLEIEGEPLESLIIHGATDRLNPILMTALTAGLALIPLALSGDVSGNEIQSPMAKVILGGLMTSTVLNLYILPMVYRWYKMAKHS